MLTFSFLGGGMEGERKSKGERGSRGDGSLAY